MFIEISKNIYLNTRYTSENSSGVVARWNKMKLNSYFPEANDNILVVAHKAFNLWLKNSNLKFINVTRPRLTNPDMTITLQKKKNWLRSNCQGRELCIFLLDGVGVLLLHM